MSVLPEAASDRAPARAEQPNGLWEIKFPAQKCTAHRTDGQPCNAWAITGGNVCVYHGGKAPQVRAAARRRLESLAPLALEIIVDLAQGKATDPSTGESVYVPAAVRARAAADILDRAGLKVANEIDLTVSEGPGRPDLDEAIAAVLTARGLTAKGDEAGSPVGE